VGLRPRAAGAVGFADFPALLAKPARGRTRDSVAQTAAASQITKRVCVLRHTHAGRLRCAARRPRGARPHTHTGLGQETVGV